MSWWVDSGRDKEYMDDTDTDPGWRNDPADITPEQMYPMHRVTWQRQRVPRLARLTPDCPFWGQRSMVLKSYKVRTDMCQILLPCYYAHLPSRCWSNRSPRQTFPGVLSDFQHCLSGFCNSLTQTVLISDCLSVFKSRPRTFYSLIRLSLNTDPTWCLQRLWSYDRIALYKFDYYYYYYYWPITGVIFKLVQGGSHNASDIRLLIRLRYEMQLKPVGGSRDGAAVCQLRVHIRCMRVNTPFDPACTSWHLRRHHTVGLSAAARYE